MTATSCTLPRLHVGAGTTIGALTTFPLWVQAPSVRGLHWSGTELTIAEIAGSPSVDELTVINRSNRPAVLLEGDLVEGGLQHRMVAASGLVAAGTTGMLAARCIEQGRWNGQQDHQATRRRAPYSVYAAERDHGGAADQGDVWRRIDRFEQRLGHTPSASMIDHLARRPAPQMPLVEGQRGVIIGIGGRVVAAEIFGRSHGLASRWAGIVGAAWLDALSAPTLATPAEQARDLVRQINPISLRTISGAGLGRRINAQVGPLALRGLTMDGSTVGSRNLVHLSAIDLSHPYVLAA